MTSVDEYRLSEKRKRTGDMFQSLKLGSIVSSGNLMRLFFYLFTIYNKPIENFPILWITCNIITSFGFSVSISQDRRHISPVRRTVTAKPPSVNAQTGEFL